MVAIQGEVVTRIDADTDEIATNVSGAQTELLRYYASVSSNRWLMLKVRRWASLAREKSGRLILHSQVFGVLIFTFLLFILVS